MRCFKCKHLYLQNGMVYSKSMPYSRQNKDSKGLIAAVIIAIVIIVISVFLLSMKPSQQVQPIAGNATTTPAETARDSKAVREVVTSFGSKLQTISVLAPTAKDDIAKTYAPFVSKDLIAEWQKDPRNAPGRVTSSPWPARIDIVNMSRRNDGSYEVQGQIVNMTSNEEKYGGDAGRDPVTVRLQNQDGRWVITDYRKSW